MAEVGSTLPDEILGHLQETLLRAVLAKESLPGGRQPVELPDLSFVLRQPAVLLSNENLARSVSLEALPVPVRVLSPQDIAEEGSTSGDIAYLRFQPAQEEDDTVRLTLQASIVPRDPGLLALGLSGIQVRFQQIEDQWEIVDEPAFFAT
jgi:hypothetical protein